MTDTPLSDIDERLMDSISKLSEPQKKELLKLAEGILKNKRECTRVDYFAEVSYADSKRAASGFIQNISAAGLYLEPKGPIAEGESVTLTFEHPTHKKQIKVTGKIIRKDTAGIGIQFLDKINDIKL